MTETTRPPARPGRSLPASALAALLVVVLVGAACGSSSTTTGGTSPGGRDRAAEVTAARASLITVGDLGTGWTASGSVSSGEHSSTSGIPIHDLATCLGVPASSLAVDAPNATSPSFGGPSGATLEDDVNVFADPAVAADQVQAFASARSPRCLLSVLGPTLKQQAASGLGSSGTVGTLTATAVPVAPVGDHAGAVELSIPVTESGGSATVHVVLEVVSVGRFASQLSLNESGSGSDAILSTAATAAVRRMRAAGG